MQHCFAPVARVDTRLLVLGSLPGVRSLTEQRYYAHPRNQFWRLIGAVIDRDLVALGYESRLAALLEAGIGLWDTVAAATRKGSLDADIRLHAASDISALAERLPKLAAIAFNGSTAARLGRRQLDQETHTALIDLPSSSPAFTMAYEQKLERWCSLRDWL